MLMWFLILIAVCLSYLGLGGRANLIVAIVLIVLGAILAFTGWSGGIRVDVD